MIVKGGAVPGPKDETRRPVRLTLQFYTHAISDDRMPEAKAMLGAILNPRGEPKRTESGLVMKEGRVKSFTIMGKTDRK